MARRRSKKHPSIIPVVVILAVCFFAVFALIRYLETEAGKMLLLDFGFTGTYGQVQDEIGKRVAIALVKTGVRRDRIKYGKETSEKSPGPIVTMRAEIHHDASLIKVNELINEHVGAIGGRVRSCFERNNGRSIAMEIGTWRKTTHRCYITRGRKVKTTAEATVVHPEIALIVDDFGYFNNRLVRSFLSLDIPLTISVIPGLKYSREICEAAVKAGKDVLCHLPMEPEQDSDDYGEIPLVRVSMSSGEVRRAVEKALETTPDVTGMNNHMGSKATADRRVMEAVLEVCRQKDLFFIDSMTTSKTVVRETAAKVGVRSLSNDLFIDNEEDETRGNMMKLLSMAVRRGRALGILHVKQGTLDDLRWFIEKAREEEVTFIKVSEMIERITLAKREGGRP